jgi:hypothetical protein
MTLVSRRVCVFLLLSRIFSATIGNASYARRVTALFAALFTKSAFIAGLAKLR